MPEEQVADRVVPCVMQARGADLTLFIGPRRVIRLEC